LLCADTLSKRFGATQALSGVSIRITLGEVRALVGRNGAGKSTLVSLLTGMLVPDGGSLQFSGEPAPSTHAREQWQKKVACVYQHPKIIPALSCAENLFLGEMPGVKSWVSWKTMRREACRVLEEWGLTLDVDKPASSLRVGERQLLEIARALQRGSRLLILDEPTAKLEAREVDHLFRHLRALGESGVGILFISHYLEEVFDLCTSVTVLLDGRVTMDGALGRLTRTDLIEAMVDRSMKTEITTRPAVQAASTPTLVAQASPTANSAVNPPACGIRLNVTSLNVRPLLQDVSFNVFAGECLGIAGLSGSGKEAIGESLAGLRLWDSGSVRLDGLELPGGDVAAHNRMGIGFVPEDRHAQGLVLTMTVADNMALTILDGLGPSGFIRPGRLESFARGMIGSLAIRVASPREPVSALSGGNQQRVVLARALARDPRVLVLIHPTAGVDIASKEVLFAAITHAASRGTAIIMISDDLEELELCDRILVIRSQRVMREFFAPYSPAALVAEMEGIAA
jgi:simple sugar transport system ATP-binding protein